MPDPQHEKYYPFKGRQGKAEGRACPTPTAIRYIL